MSDKPNDLHIFGIRHHGPGSALALVRALQELQPDTLLIEGPSDADEMIPWLGHEEMEPPVTLILYRPDQPKRAAYFPFAAFSPEYQAVRYGVAAGIPVHFMDLPQGHLLAIDTPIAPPEMQVMTALAKAAGYDHHETWWNSFVEQRQADPNLFPAILAMMEVARATTPVDVPNAAAPTPTLEKAAAAQAAGQLLANRREAQMRQTIRRARADGHQRIAVVCGAWHGPALIDLAHVVEDETLLADLPLVTVEAAWAPWSYSRLATFSGYSAGIHSPGWYHYLWESGRAGHSPTDRSIGWLSQIAHLLRDEGFDASAAHVIEGVRLAESLAALRDLPSPGLHEYNEAVLATFGFGDPTPLRLIERKLIVGERMGWTPNDAPMTPLQRDLHTLQRRLRLRPEAEPSTLNLDLRNESHLERSYLLHRLQILHVAWGKALPVRNQGGTSREVWRLQWQPDLAIRVIEASVWGNTVHDAAAASATDAATQATDLPALTHLLDQIILAGLPENVIQLMARIDEIAARNSDIIHMIEALPPLVQVLRYGNVRQTDKQAVKHVVDGLLTRICIGLPSACATLDDDAAAEMVERLNSVHGVVRALQNRSHRDAWHALLQQLIDQNGLHGLLAGRICRLLFEARLLTKIALTVRLTNVLSTVNGQQRPDDRALIQAAFWLEGFVQGSGLLLVHDQSLWELIDEWVNGLDQQQFRNTLPMLRRAFGGFNKSVRQQLHDRVKAVERAPQQAQWAIGEFDHTTAAQVLPRLGRYLGMTG